MTELNFNRRDFIKLSALGLAVAASSRLVGSAQAAERVVSPEPEHADTYAFTTGLGPGSLVLVTKRSEQTVRVIIGNATETTDTLMDGTTVDATEMRDWIELTSPVANPIVETEEPVTKVEDQRIETTRTFEFPLAFDASLLSVGAANQMEKDVLDLVNEARIAATTGRKEVAGIGKLVIDENRSKNVLRATFSASVDPHDYIDGYSGPNIETRPITLIELATEATIDEAVRLPGVVNHDVLIHGVPNVDPKPRLAIPEGPAKELEDNLKRGGLELRMENDGIHAAIYKEGSALPINDVLVNMSDPKKPTWSRDYTYLDFKGHPDEELINNRICLPQPLENITVDEKGEINFDFPGYVWNTEKNQFERKTFEGEVVYNTFEAQLRIIKYGDVSTDTFYRRDFDHFMDFKTASLKINSLDEPIKGQYVVSMHIPLRSLDAKFTIIRTAPFALNVFSKNETYMKYSFSLYKDKNGKERVDLIDQPFLFRLENLNGWSDYYISHPESIPNDNVKIIQ